MYEDDYFEYKLQHACRIIEEDRFSGTILCGNELVNIGVREEGGLGYAEMEIVDYFLWRIEFFNHSGKYKGVVVVDEIFNDDRYGPVSVVLCQDLAQNKMRSFATKLLTENRPSHTFFQSR